MSIYYEKCQQNTMENYPFFIDNLLSIQKLTISDKEYNFEKICELCQNNKYYQLANIVWSDNIVHLINEHHSYPSQYFIDVIIHTIIINDQIINLPLNDSHYIPLHHNKLLVLDALMKQGSKQQYLSEDQKEMFAEHSGVLTLNNNSIDSIIVNTGVERYDKSDNTILLPNNVQIFSEHKILFHTHPFISVIGGRIKEGIIFEFPSSNDIFNFAKYYQELAQASIIVAPEGLYVIRAIDNTKEIIINPNINDQLRKLIIALEKKAYQKYQSLFKDFSVDIFFEKIAYDFYFINLYNQFIKKANVYIEYYPRIKKNNDWILRQIFLQIK